MGLMSYSAFISQNVIKAQAFIAPVMYVNYFIIFLLSSTWAVHLIHKITKDYRREKLKIKQGYNQPEFIWKNELKNFRSNRIKNAFLLAICLSECLTTISIVYMLADLIRNCGFYPKEAQPPFVIDSLSPVIFIDNKLLYHDIVQLSVFRIFYVFTTISVYSVALFLRNLTQYMVSQYTFYQQHWSLRFELFMSLYTLLFLFIMGIISQLITLYCICILLVILREIVLLVKSSRNLCTLLKQRLNDAIHHENHANGVIIYYKLAYREYKYSSIIFLFAFIINF